MLGRVGLLGLVVMTVGCGSARFKVPAAEVQRLAQLPPNERAMEVRVIPWNAAIMAPPGYAPSEQPGPTVATQVVVDLRLPPAHRHHAASFGRPLAGGSVGRSATSWRGTPRASMPVPRSGGGGHGGHSARGGGAAVAAVVAVVGVVAVAAVIAQASARHSERVRFARTYDGWVTVNPEHTLHLIYEQGRRRSVPLSQLTAQDVVGLRHAYLKDEELGKVVPLNLPPNFLPVPPAPEQPPPGGPPMQPPPPMPRAPSAPPPSPPRALEQHPALVS